MDGGRNGRELNEAMNVLRMGFRRFQVGPGGRWKTVAVDWDCSNNNKGIDMRMNSGVFG